MTEKWVVPNKVIIKNEELSPIIKKDVIEDYLAKPKIITKVSEKLGTFDIDSYAQNKICTLILKEDWPGLHDFFTKDEHGRQIRDKWNQEFDQQRPVELAKQIQPYLIGGTMLDLCCGNGLVGKQIQTDFDINVHFSERDHDLYKGFRAENWYSYHHLENLFHNLIKIEFDNLLLSSVLHHELSPKKVCKNALKLKPRRIILVENPILPNYGHKFQILADYFYQRGLNYLPDEIPGIYKTNSQWIEFWQDIVAETNAIITDINIQIEAFDLPGMLQPNSLITIDLAYV